MTDLDLTDAVEAAARAWFDRGQKGRMDAGRLNDDGTPIRWEHRVRGDWTQGLLRSVALLLRPRHLPRVRIVDPTAATQRHPHRQVHPRPRLVGQP